MKTNFEFNWRNRKWLTVIARKLSLIVLILGFTFYPSPSKAVNPFLILDLSISGIRLLGTIIEEGAKVYDNYQYEKSFEPEPDSQEVINRKKLEAGLGHLKDKKYDQAFKELHPFATQGNPKIQLVIGIMLLNGLGVDINEGLAAEWLTKSANSGIGNAKYLLAIQYERGVGIPKDIKKAIEMYQDVAIQGNAYAQNILGSHYTNGQFLKVDFKKAEDWYRKSASQGYGVAQYNLGALLGSKYVDKKDVGRAVYWLENALKNGVSQAKVKIEEYREYDPPIVNVNGVKSGVFITEALNTKISGRASDRSGVTSLLIDEVIVPVEESGSFHAVVKSPIGRRKISVEAIDVLGNKGSTDFVLERSRSANDNSAPLDPLIPPEKFTSKQQNRFALIIGIEDYESLPTARYAKRDAARFYDFATEVLGVPSEGANIRLISGAKATRLEIFASLSKWLKPETSGGQAEVFIFFSGHGLASPDGEKRYLLPYDADTQLLKFTAISVNRLIEEIRSMDVKTATIMFDASFSGNSRGVDQLVASARPIFLQSGDLTIPKNISLLTAASGTQGSSIVEEQGHGLFSYFLMRGLQGIADSNGDKNITIGELHAYTNKEFNRLGYKQTPQIIGSRDYALVSGMGRSAVAIKTNSPMRKASRNSPKKVPSPELSKQETKSNQPTSQSSGSFFERVIKYFEGGTAN